MRRCLVWPSDMIWPNNLPYIALFRTLHEKEHSASLQWLNMSRRKFFIIVCSCQAIYYWLPGYIMPVLSAFSWLCMCNTKNILLSQLTGFNGFAIIGVLILNWRTIRGLFGSPIVVPFWAHVNILVGFVCVFWILMPIAYYTNLAGFKYLPISVYNPSAQFFTADGNYFTDGPSSSRRVPISPIFTSYIVYASFVALGVHTILYHGRDIIQQFRTSLKNRENDIHCTLMSKYPEAPEWWYIIVFIIAFIIACIICHIDNYMPWYFLFLTTVFSFIFLLPIGIVQAKTNLYIDTSFITIIGGSYLVKVSPIGTVTLSVFCNRSLFQALDLLSNLKLGHYMKISPRAMFTIQLVITALSAIVKYAIGNYLVHNIPQLCSSNSTDWSCPAIAIDILPITYASQGG
ncbi:unnamed protein product [Didymodactylos carnosus]|uniref:Uncharacterized protein n=1 Tax=Didymodactylos carnosus TaxID=1234261 RepID=A0A8S2HQ30_9BILA|nr:unnamed protein product [Didymodactylos carnosus]CAF3670292.1 unnamed protein product [Didymodactylos carnosus]